MFDCSIVTAWKLPKYGVFFWSVFVLNTEIYAVSHMKRKGSLEGSLVRVLFAVELEFLKILVPRLTQNISNVKNESTRKSKQLYYLWLNSWSPDISLCYCSDINLFFIMSGVNCAINGCSSSRTTPGA